MKKFSLLVFIFLTACATSQPQITSISEPVITSTSPPATETPDLNSEYISLVPANFERMSMERIVELEYQYKNGVVYEYVTTADTKKHEVKWVYKHERLKSVVLAGYSLISENGLKTEIIVVNLNDREFFVRNDGEFMTNLLDINDQEYRLLGEYSQYEILSG